ncbi:GH1 family beta-glucosidase [Actinokineospora spheciospongiae]|uniref:GH1 family beta-glucosidase n=1 Tax=Actinokineospora spheciospongiae TaxID=909613 RepID=UPI000D71C6C9|nr:GH1 family beta-glucosidase [Actinokineospora spheciospongiae]PWW56904.1 beta-glucosidase [Actinokineospora spheciospongiae]
MTEPFPAFPPDFLWGAASAAYQVEGAVDEDGRGRSVWDTFCAEPGRVEGGDTGAVAADHYHRFPEDIALLRDLGVGAYRFSIAWPRVVPDGAGAVNPAGLDFYDRLVDELCAAGIAPAATLFHWDTPQALEDAGGWLSRDTAARFAEYAAVVGDRLHDRVRMWMPLNEPVVVTMFGYALGQHAPGRELGFEALPTAHHQLLGHGLAVQALRAAGCSNIGIASNHSPVWAASDAEEDVAAADTYSTLVNWLFADPVLRGRYPAPELAALMPGPVVEDLKVISTPLDWFGINYYQPALVGAATGGSTPVVEGAMLPPGLPFEPRPIEGYPRTDFGWPVVPDGLRETVAMFTDRYGEALPPLYITESGCSYHDPDPVDGRVPDPDRVAYHDGHLRALARAMADGADVRGYFAWAATDNFEWAAGYRERFGLVHVDYATQTRTPKDSYHWYRDVIGRAR